jgi:hypothetical protein
MGADDEAKHNSPRQSPGSPKGRAKSPSSPKGHSKIGLDANAEWSKLESEIDDQGDSVATLNPKPKIPIPLHLNLIPCILSDVPYTVYPITWTLYPIPYKPYTLDPIPYTL